MIFPIFVHGITAIFIFLQISRNFRKLDIRILSKTLNLEINCSKLHFLWNLSRREFWAISTILIVYWYMAFFGHYRLSWVSFPATSSDHTSWKSADLHKEKTARYQCKHERIKAETVVIVFREGANVSEDSVSCNI